MQPAPQPTLYDLLESLPEGLTGEILDGQLHTMPRPSAPHGRASAMLSDGIFGPYDRGRGGPGGWWIFVEPEVHFIRDREVAVPDLAGWKRQRMPDPPQDQRFEVVPDWVCEIVSPSTESKDRRIKMPLYARYAVPFAWLVDPIARTLEAYTLEAGNWREIGRFSTADQVTIAPFEAVTLDLDGLWLPRNI
ncbi:MAG: Uma2 family endonuclease [Chromatiaceae bacterium]|jgi:Uma2 family endonuclease